MRLLLFVALARAVVGDRFQCPDWKLSNGDFTWGVYKGALDENNVCLYSDVRFASPPTGSFRFQPPRYPPTSPVPAAPGPAMSCHQVDTAQGGVGKVLLPPRSSKGDQESYGIQDEDCLFLDVYIPPAAFTATKPVPVVNWFYGGAYFFGSKTFFDPKEAPFYSGDGVVNTASKSEPIIFVAGNYRLGAFGWLAGNYMETHGQPNAGLLDQRAILQFIHDFLPSIRGTANPLALGPVSVWGESAGASSIMHHLAMPLNIATPLFQRALLQSPAYQWKWNRTDMDVTYHKFATIATADLKGSCAGSADIACLQQANLDTLVAANQGLFDQYIADGTFPVGPSVDNNLIPVLASVRFEDRSTVVHLDGIIVSHVNEEIHPTLDPTASSFIPRKIRAEPHNVAVFEAFLKSAFLSDDIVDQVVTRYPSAAFRNQVERVTAIIIDSSFTCHTRFIIERYLADATRVYAMDYAVLAKEHAAVHASDLLPTFANAHTDYAPLIEERLPVDIPFVPAAINRVLTKVVAPGMQTFFTGHAIAADPNRNRGPDLSPWLPARIAACPPGTAGTCVTNLMKPSFKEEEKHAFQDNAGPDMQTASSRCDFWRGIANQLTYGTEGDGSGGGLNGLGGDGDAQAAFLQEL